MLKVDRLGWADGLTFNWHGMKVGVRVNGARMLDQIRSYLPPNLEPVEDNRVDRIFSLWTAEESRKGVRGFHMAFSDHSVVLRSLELDLVLRAVQDEIEAFLAITAKRRVFVRAGVVELKGGALIILGTDSSGTSTLVRSLTEQGAQYLSDRFAILDTKGRVHPLPAPSLCGKEDGTEDNSEITRASRRLPKGPLPVKGIIQTTYHPGANWRPRRMTPAQAVIAMLQRTPVAHNKPDTALSALSNAAESAVSITSKRGEADIAASDILRRFS